MLRKYFTQPNFLMLLLIILTGFILRVYKIGTNYYFSGELGKELLFIRQFAENHSFPLTGMATSHSWLYYGPLYYWVMIPIFNIWSGNPFILFWVALIISIIGLILNYWVVKKIVDDRVALFATGVQALSPLLIWQTRLSKLHVFFWVLMPIFMYLLYLMWNGRKKCVFFAGLIFGVLFSFHFSQIPLLGIVALLFWIKKDTYKTIDHIKFMIGLLIPNLTLIWRDKDLILWLPYRVIGAIDKNPSTTFQSINEYFGKTIFWNQGLWFIGLILFVVLFVHYIYVNRKTLTSSFLPFYLISSICLVLVANIIHGVPPIHYFLPIFTTVPILLAIYLSRYKFWPLVVVPILLINFWAFLKEPVFYKSFRGNVRSTDIVNYETQNNTVSFILMNTKHKEFSIKRVGPFDYFPEGYSQNYKYLALWRGGYLDDDSKNVYTIIENEGGVNVQK